MILDRAIGDPERAAGRDPLDRRAQRLGLGVLEQMALRASASRASTARHAWVVLSAGKPTYANRLLAWATTMISPTGIAPTSGIAPSACVVGMQAGNPLLRGFSFVGTVLDRRHRRRYGARPAAAVTA